LNHSSHIVLGVDFDNTIVCYDDLFHRVALEQGLMPVSTPRVKDAVREHLRQAGKEEAWTELQGCVYGKRIRVARPFAGVREFLRTCRAVGIDVYIVSHKTRHPHRGPRYDLHAAALDWLEYHGFFDPAGVGISRDRVFFEPGRAEKLARAATLAVTHFMDDLPEFLLMPGFPVGIVRLLFDPAHRFPDHKGLAHIHAWSEVEGHLAVRSPGPPASDRPLPRGERWERAINLSRWERAFHLSPWGRGRSDAGGPGEGTAVGALGVTGGGCRSRPAVNGLTEATVRQTAASLLARIGADAAFELSALPGGRNNRLFRVDAGGAAYCLKLYFSDFRDGRDRCGTEYGFVKFMWESGVRTVPRPLAGDPLEQAALYEFVEGRRLEQSDVDAGRVREAMQFIAAVNEHRDRDRAAELADASEACFSLRDHVAMVQKRVDRLHRALAPRDLASRGARRQGRGSLRGV